MRLLSLLEFTRYLRAGHLLTGEGFQGWPGRANLSPRGAKKRFMSQFCG